MLQWNLCFKATLKNWAKVIITEESGGGGGGGGGEWSEVQLHGNWEQQDFAQKMVLILGQSVKEEKRPGINC